ncbi:MAG: hypothetical protein ABJ092_11430 [Gillisia sp.]
MDATIETCAVRYSIYLKARGFGYNFDYSTQINSLMGQTSTNDETFDEQFTLSYRYEKIHR